MIWPWRRKSRRRMARVVLEGPISGSTRHRVLKALKEVEEREFPALLLRIDSPGGTVGDSQEIHAALMRVREKGCRVVASFGNISASGGVYIGVAAEKIVSNPGTITGSIGVILRGNDLSRLFERIGIRFDTVKSGMFKDILSPDRPLSEAERELLQQLIDSSYGQFVDVVAEGRGLTPETVRGFADGRVFSGAQALELGLVDELGDEEHARRRPGWDTVALLDCQQMAVDGDLPRCIRLLAHVWLPADRDPAHPYLEDARHLRPDRLSHN